MEDGAGTLKLLGGRLCLDLANTVDWHASDEPHEWLTDFSALVAWAAHAGALAEDEAKRVTRWAWGRPGEAQAFLARTIALREALYRLFTALAHGDPPSDTDLGVLNRELATVGARAGLVARGDGFSWEWQGEQDAPERLLWPILRDALDLLRSDDLDRVGQCEDDRCGWLFVDKSRNRSRRWCAMEDCGNRAKARRHYRRARAAS